MFTYYLVHIKIFPFQRGIILFQNLEDKNGIWSIPNRDSIWENPPHVVQGNFVEIKKIILKLLPHVFLYIFITFDAP